MGATNYHSIGGRIVGETTAGVRLPYLRDALGSVAATATQVGTLQSSARYKPFGGTLATTGIPPRFGWDGQWGYLSTGLSWSNWYVRARHLYGGAFSTQDPLWPDEHPFSYVTHAPTTAIDPEGLHRHSGCDSCGVKFSPEEVASVTSGSGLLQLNAKLNDCPEKLKIGVRSACRLINSLQFGRKLSRINECIRRSYDKTQIPDPKKLQLITRQRLTCMRQFCQEGTVHCYGPRKHYFFGSREEVNYTVFNPYSFKKAPFDDCEEPLGTIFIPIEVGRDYMDTADTRSKNYRGAFIHELLHSCGVSHRGHYGELRPGVDFETNVLNNVMTCCIINVLVDQERGNIEEHHAFTYVGARGDYCKDAFRPSERTGVKHKKK